MSKLVKNDQGKPDLTYLPYEALTELAYVAEFGASKYGRGSWDVDDPTGSVRRRFIAAALRHLHKRASGEKFDDESGLDHLAHAAMSCLFAISISKKEFKREILEPKKKTSLNLSFFCNDCEDIIEVDQLPDELICELCKNNS